MPPYRSLVDITSSPGLNNLMTASIAARPDPNANPKLFSLETIQKIWEDESTEIGYYPELDLNGNKKLYKVLTV